MIIVFVHEPEHGIKKEERLSLKNCTCLALFCNEPIARTKVCILLLTTCHDKSYGKNHPTKIYIFHDEII